jgi:hypothetical protein
MTIKVTGEIPEEVADGENLVFTTEFSFITGSVAVFVGGVRRYLVEDYNETDIDGNPSNNQIKFVASDEAPYGPTDPVLFDYEYYEGLDADSATIREEILMMYPQIMTFAKNILDESLVFDPDSGLTVTNILNKFIQKSKRKHDITFWETEYQQQVVLLTCHFISMAQKEKLINTGIQIESRGDSSQGETTTYFPPNPMHGPYSTTKYGREWYAGAVAKGNKVEVDSI